MDRNPDTDRHQKPVTRRDWTTSPVPEFSRDPHPLIVGFLWMLPTAMLTGTFIGMNKFGNHFGTLMGKLGLNGQPAQYIGSIIVFTLVIAFIAGPGLMLSILTMSGPRYRKDLNFCTFQFFYAQLLVIPLLILVFYLISRLFVK